jgi:hypothetical protein
MFINIHKSFILQSYKNEMKEKIYKKKLDKFKSLEMYKLKKNKFINSLNKILNYIILKNKPDDVDFGFGDYSTTHYIYLLRCIIDEKYKNDQLITILNEDVDEIIKDFDFKTFFENKYKLSKNI